MTQGPTNADPTTDAPEREPGGTVDDLLGTEAPADTGDVDTPDTPETPEVPEGEYVDLGGDIGKLTMDEVRKGYLRQSDFTRKTQELSTQRQQIEALQQALSTDPKGTILELAKRLNVDLAAQADDQLDAEDPYMKQFNPRIQQLEQELKAQQEWARQQAESQAEQRIQTELTQVTEYAKLVGLPMEEATLIQYAIDHNSPDLRTAFLSMNADAIPQLRNSTEAKRALAARRGGVAPTKTGAPTGKNPTFEEAFASAKKDLGVSSVDDLLS